MLRRKDVKEQSVGRGMIGTGGKTGAGGKLGIGGHNVVGAT